MQKSIGSIVYNCIVGTFNIIVMYQHPIKFASSLCRDIDESMVVGLNTGCWR